MGLDIPRDGRVKLIYPYWSRSAVGHGMRTEAFGAQVYEAPVNDLLLLARMKRPGSPGHIHKVLGGHHVHPVAALGHIPLVVYVA
jgi:hypothetical protein